MNPSLQAADNLPFDEIEVGQTFLCTHHFSAADLDLFAKLSGDYSPLHMDAKYSRESGFSDRVVHGMLLASLFSRLIGMNIPGRPALYLGQDLAFRTPIVAGQEVTASMKVASKSESTRSLTLLSEIRTDSGKIAVSGTAKVRVRSTAKESDGTADMPARLVDQAPSVQGSQAVALVTGGSRGIGAEVALNFALDGLAVAITYLRNSAQADSVVEKIRTAGGTAISIAADIRDEVQMTTAVAVVIERFGRLDKLVNAAIGELHSTNLSELNWDAFEGHLQTQIKGVLLSCKAAYPYLKTSPEACIVNVLSQVVHNSPPTRMADYVTAKYALQGLSKAMAAEWSAEGIRVNSVSPGLTQTDLTLHYQERIFKMEANKTPLKRLCTAQDVARAVTYLASDKASYITGVDMPVTGGQVMT